MLLILTPNPALDRTFVLETLTAGAVHRTDTVIDAAGGKGLNVARAALTLGQANRVAAPLGGLIGRRVAELAATEGIALEPVELGAGATRICVIVAEASGRDATVFNEAGPPVAPADWARFLATSLTLAAGADLVALCGSLPPGVDPQSLPTLFSALAQRNKRIIVDTSGAALAVALEQRCYGIKVNGAELGAALGRRITTAIEALPAIAELRARGIELAVVTLGAQGALAADAHGAWWARPPAIRAVSSVGSGDSLLAGLVTGLLRGLALSEALRLGVACGAADAETIGGGRFSMTRVDELAAETVVTQAAPG
jgi:1-phosphofructokinase family hexose kinase